MAVRTSYVRATREDKTSTFLGHLKIKDCGTVDITTDANGDGSATVTFNQPFKNTPVIVALAQEADTTGTLSISSKSTTGFTIQVDGSSVVSGTLTVGWIAIEPG